MLLSSLFLVPLSGVFAILFTIYNIETFSIAFTGGVVMLLITFLALVFNSNSTCPVLVLNNGSTGLHSSVINKLVFSIIHKICKHFISLCKKTICKPK